MLSRIKYPALTSLVLILCFLVTFYIRYSYLTYKVPSVEQGNIFLLTTLENFFKRGISNCNYSPIQTWGNEGDKSITYYKRVEDIKGNNYYVSHPPFTFIFTYYLFRIFNVYPNEFSLQIIGMILHLIGAVFVYLIVLEYFDKKGLVLFLPALISYTTYLFIPVMMYLNLFNIFAETFVQPFWIIAIYLALRIFKQTAKKISILQLILFGVVIFLMIYTEWLGVFFAFSLCFICFYYSHKDHKYTALFNVTVISGVLALIVIFFQYSRIDGLRPLLHNLYIRFIERSGYFGYENSDDHKSILNPDSYLLLLKQINNLFSGLGYLFLGMFLMTIFLSIRNNKFTFQLSQEVKYMLMLSVVPPLLYFIIFFNASVIHYIYIAKFAVPISIFIGIIYKKLILSFKQTKIVIIGFAIIKVLVVIVSVIIFSATAKDKKEKNNLYLEQVAEIIKTNSAEDEAVFVNIPPKPSNALVYLTYKSKRNLMFSVSSYHARKLLPGLKKSKGVYFTFNLKKYNKMFIEPQKFKKEDKFYTIEPISVNLQPEFKKWK